MNIHLQHMYEGLVKQLVCVWSISVFCLLIYLKL